MWTAESSLASQTQSFEIQLLKACRAAFSSLLASRSAASRHEVPTRVFLFAWYVPERTRSTSNLEFHGPGVQNRG